MIMIAGQESGQEATVRTGHRTTDWFQIGKGALQGCILLPCLLATHSSVLAWRIPGTGEPGGLPSMGSQRVGLTERLHSLQYV